MDVIFFIIVFEVMDDHSLNVIRPFAQWWNNELNDVDSIVQIFTEAAVLNFFLKVLIGGCNKTEIQRLVRKLAEEGMSVTFISSEIEEMLRTCSRLIVMRDRHIVGELKGTELTQEHVMRTIAGGGD